MLDIELSVYDKTMEEEDFFQKASFLARLGSGSASRSLYGGFVLWGRMPEMENSSDEFAVMLSARIHPVFRTFRDAILILDDQKKSVSSSVGHQLMEDHPFSAARFSQAKKNVCSLNNILINGDLKKFIDIVESEALILHALMLASKPGYILMLPNTIEAIKRIRDYRNKTKVPLCFTLDAGPNIHLLFPEVYEDKVKDFIVKEMNELCHRDQFIIDCVGTGPVRI
jgi:diphosphomevalonate decarboxylase